MFVLLGEFPVGFRVKLDRSGHPPSSNALQSQKIKPGERQGAFLVPECFCRVTAAYWLDLSGLHALGSESGPITVTIYGCEPHSVWPDIGGHFRT